MGRSAHGAHQVVGGAGGDALDVGLLDDGRECLLGHAAGLEEAGEVAAPAQLWDTQLDGARQGLPIPVAVTVTLVGPLGAALVRAGAAAAYSGRCYKSLSGVLHHDQGHDPCPEEVLDAWMRAANLPRRLANARRADILALLGPEAQPLAVRIAAAPKARQAAR